MTLNEFLSQLGLSKDSDSEAIAIAVLKHEQQLQDRMESSVTVDEKAEVQKSFAILRTAQTALAKKSKKVVPQSALSQTQERDLPVKAVPDEASGLSQTQARDLPSLAVSMTATPHGRGDTDGDRDAPDGGLGLKTGDVLAQRYEIRALIGRGGMGAVFSTYDRVRGEEIAVKVLLPHLLRDPQARERFTNEAKIASSLSHPNIVRVFDIQQDGDKTFLTMELLKGKSLREVIIERQAKSQRFTVDEVRHIGEQLCDALSHAHTQTIHRDVKPENIWLCDDGTLKLMDFGIARLLRPSQFTSMGLGMGTAYYMAPEQLKAQKEIDHRADQYAVAVVLYELLTGEIPQGAIQAPHEVRRNIPRGVSLGVMQALGGNPDKRFANMSGLQHALHAQQSNVKIPRWAMAAAVAVLLLGVGGTYPLWIGAVTSQFYSQFGGEARSRAISARTNAEQARENWREQTSGLAPESLPAAAAEAELKWQAGVEAITVYEFAAAADEFVAVETLLAESEVLLKANRESMSLMQQVRTKMETAQQNWEAFAATLPDSLLPDEARQAPESRTAAEEALAANDYAAATAGYLATANLYIAARDVGENTQKMYAAVKSQLELLSARRIQWQQIAAAFETTELPATAAEAEAAYANAQEAMVRGELQIASEETEKAEQSFGEAFEFCRKRLEEDAAVAGSRAKGSLRNAESVATTLQSNLEEAQRRVAQTTSLGDASPSRATAQAELAAAQDRWDQYSRHAGLSTWLEEARTAFTAGESLRQSQPQAAGKYFDQAHTSANRVASWQRSIELTAQATQASSEQKHDLAVTLAGEALQNYAESAEALQVRAGAWLAKQDYQQAIDDCTAALAIDESAPALFELRARAWVRMNEYERAVDDCTKAIGLDSKFVDAYLTRASAWGNLATVDTLGRALKDCDDAVRLSNSSAAALALRASTRLAFAETAPRPGETELARMLDQAVNDAQGAFKSDTSPNDQKVLFDALRRRMELRLTQAPNNPATDLTTLKTLAAWRATVLDDAKTAVKAVGTPVPGIDAIAAQATLIFHERSQRLVADTRAYIGKDQATTAIAKCNEYLGIVNDWDQMYEVRGDAQLADPRAADIRARARNQVVNDAIASFTSSLQVAPAADLPRLHGKRAEAYYSAGRYKEAIADFEHLISRDPTDTGALLRRADGYQGLRQYLDALKEYDKLLASGVKSAAVHRSRATALYAQEDYQATIREATLAIELDQSAVNRLAYAARAMAYFHTDQIKNSLADADQVIRLAPISNVKDSKDIWFRHESFLFRGYLNSRTGNHGKAIEDYSDAMRIVNYHHQTADVSYEIATFEILENRSLSYVKMGKMELGRSDMRARLTASDGSYSSLYGDDDPLKHIPSDWNAFTLYIGMP